MKEFAAAQNIAETDKTKGSILLKKYRELGGKAVNKALFTDISSLLRYEQSRLLESRSQWFSGAAARYHERKERKERIDELAKKFPDIVQNGSDAPNTSFFDYYTKTIAATASVAYFDTNFACAAMATTVRAYWTAEGNPTDKMLFKCNLA